MKNDIFPKNSNGALIQDGEENIFLFFTLEATILIC
jgi:hypothetical protein